MKTGTGVKWVIVVCGIILVACLMVPTVTSEPHSAYVTRSKMRIGELSDGCNQYKQDNERYPGQMQAATIGTGKGPRSGAQFLARAMFTKVMADGETQYPVGRYVTYIEGDLIDADGVTGLVSDRFPDPMPILYYPSRIGVSGLAQYVEADNAVHTDAHRGDRQIMLNSA